MTNKETLYTITYVALVRTASDSSFPSGRANRRQSTYSFLRSNVL